MFMLHCNKYISNVFAFAILASSTSYAVDSPGVIKQLISGGDPVAGKEKSANCRGCHGEDGNSVASNSPKLAGQYSDYILSQINNFQTGTRKNPTMTGIVATLTSKRDLIDMAAYFASQKQMTGIPSNNLIGQNLNLKYGCLGCHGEDGKGRPAYNSIFPVIGGQHKNYLVKQLKDFKSGARDTDVSGAMSELTKKMTNDEIEAISDFLSGL